MSGSVKRDDGVQEKQNKKNLSIGKFCQGKTQEFKGPVCKILAACTVENIDRNNLNVLWKVAVRDLIAANILVWDFALNCTLEFRNAISILKYVFRKEEEEKERRKTLFRSMSEEDIRLQKHSSPSMKGPPLSG